MRIPRLEDVQAIEALLAESGLPTDDLSQQDLSLFRIEGTGNSLSAVGGLERFHNTALLRSVATAAAMQGQGIASRIVGELENIAVDEGIENLYLLTESAQRYFESKGYKVVERADVPGSIRESRQFSTLCPDSATVMYKRVGM